eukprot:gene38285-46522_t
MEYFGVLIDTQRMPQIAAQAQEALKTLEKSIHDLAGVKFNVSSPEQLSKVLFDTMQLQAEASDGSDAVDGDASKSNATEKKKHLSTSEEELVKLKDKHPIIALILDYRALSKILHTYLEGMTSSVSQLVPPSVHPIWNQTSVRTGRLSCAKPNMQNIPNAQQVLGNAYNIRSLFYPRPGYVFVCADYSQIEIRVLAHLTQDPTLLGLFRQEGDIYNQLASRIFRKPEREIGSEERSKAKVICLGVLYGMGPYAIAAKLKMDVATAAKITQSFFNNFANVKVWITRIKSQTKQYELVKTLLGRIRLLPDINSADKSSAAAAERQAVNSIIQGTAADMIKLAMILSVEMVATLDKIEDDGDDARNARLVMQIHDELIFEVPDEPSYLAQFISRLKLVMEEDVVKRLSLSVPLVTNVSVGQRWGEVQAWSFAQPPQPADKFFDVGEDRI